METTTNEMTSQQGRPTFQLKRSLLPIAEYAAREGVSKAMVEECGKLGIVQIRKYKGKTFVVDMPLSPYLYTSENTAEPAHLLEKKAHAEKISKLVQGLSPAVPETTEESANSDEIGVNADATSHSGETVQPTPPETPSINLSEPIKPPDMQIFEIANGPPELVNEAVETGEEPDSFQRQQDDEFSFEVLLAAQARSKRAWQIVTVFSMLCFFTALFANLWLYMDRRIQLDKLEQANVGIKKFLTNSEQARRQAETAQKQLTDTKAELKRVKAQLSGSRAQVETLRNQLTQAEQNIQTIQKRNAGAVNWLNKQIEKLESRLNRLTENR